MRLTIILAATLVTTASPAMAQSVRFTSDLAASTKQDVAACASNPDIWWCATGRAAPEKRYADETTEINRVDRGVRAGFTYSVDQADAWTSHNADIEAGKKWSGDCDDLTMTTLDYMAWDGYPTDRMWRVGMVIDKGDRKVDHMIGVVETSDGKQWIVGDVNRPAYPLADFDKVYEGRAKITYASRMDAGLMWRPARIAR